MRPITIIACLSLALLSVPGCGDGHDHHDHSHKDHHHHHDHSGPNPHVWLDPVKVKTFVAGVTPVLEQAIEDNDGKPVIVVTIFPLQTLVEAIVGDKATVKTLVAPGATPHGFEVKAPHLTMLREAKVLITVGYKFDDWAAKAMRESHPDDKPTIISMESTIKSKEATAAATGDFKTNADQLLAKLDALHQRHETELAKATKKELVTFHNAFDPLAERYGMKVVAHLTEIELSHGSEVTPQQLKAAREAVNKHQLKVLYSEPQFPDSAMKAIRDATDVDILRLDPIGNPNVEGYRDYFQMMESNLRTLVAGQSR